MKRLFLAAPVGQTDKAFFEGVATKFRSALSPKARVKWASPDHITFHFLGDVDAPTEQRLKDCLKAVSWSAFLLRLDSLAVFPTETEGRVLVVKSNVVPKGARDLHGALGNILHMLAIPLEKRAFLPHVTFGRLARQTKVTVPPLTDTLSILVDRVCLFQSHLEPTGARYEVLETWKGRV